MRNRFLFLILVFLLPTMAFPQEPEADVKYKPLIIYLADDKKEFIRFITWNQFWIENPDLTDNRNFSLKLRRARLLTYAQLSDRFKILTHIGLNSLTSDSMDPIGNRKSQSSTLNSAQLFLHAAWSEYRVSRDNSLYLGGGLHYWNGLSRFSSASTLNFMTLDNHRQAWSQLGLSDQFGRHLGIFAKGEYRSIRYTIAINEAIYEALGSVDLSDMTEGSISYSGRKIFGDDAKRVITGRLEYQLMDKESMALPYRTGTYLGTKSIFNIGAGFFYHKNGTVSMENGPVKHNVAHFSGDLYYDAPLGNGAVNLYLSYYHFDYGKDYTYKYVYGSGDSFYGQFGYLLSLNERSGKLMPYLSYGQNHFTAFQKPSKDLRMGMNWFIHGHNAKLTIEFGSKVLNYNLQEGAPPAVNSLTLQSQIFL